MTNWDWREEMLKHPDGRAQGGEPCVRCKSPISSGAIWKYRDRHVCSNRCNISLKSLLKRRINKGELIEPPAGPKVEVREDKNPRHFPMVWTAGENEVPFEYDGYGPLHGDSIERWGVVTAYIDVPLPNLSDPHGEYKLGRLAIHESGHAFAYYVEENGMFGRVRWGHFYNGERIHGTTFEYNSEVYEWRSEIVRCIASDGEDYEWWTIFCIRKIVEEPEATWWSPEYRKRSEAMKRARDHLARNLRRLRKTEGSEKFDPNDVYEINEWICGICDEEVDRKLVYPDPMSKSLDHILPLSLGGKHTMENAQLAHLICNIRKGNRI